LRSGTDIPELSERRGGGLERVMLLRSFGPFRAIAPAHLVGLAELTTDRFFPAGATIHGAGAAVEEIHYLIDGEVEVRRSGRTPRRLGPRSIIGGLAALAGVQDTADVVAVRDATTLCLQREDQFDLFDEDFELLVQAVRAVTGAFLDARRSAQRRSRSRLRDAPTGPARQSLDLIEKLMQFRRGALCKGAGVEELARLARESPEVHFAAGEPIWASGEPGTSHLLVVSGMIRGVSIGAAGEQRFSLTSGSVAGALDSLAVRPRWFGATALTDVCAVEVQAGTVFDVFEDHVGMALDVLRVLATGALNLRDGQTPLDRIADVA
jgi:CRP-like cAMP-binding protein